ncbi:competence protein [Fluviicola sp.]|uniref:competence protein n=1 Tax=Fluviicola sp. TaxID=1917219 RepID=UPI0031E1AC5B
MAFDELKENTQQIQEEAKAYLESTIQYYKLWGFKIMMKSTKMVVKVFLLSFFLMMFLIFGSVSAALAIGEALQSMWLGFLIVAGVYLVLILLLLFVRSKIIERQILRKCSTIFLND